MSKKIVTWDQPKIASAAVKPGHYRSFAEFMAKANALAEEQQAAEAYLQKAMPAMVALLEFKMRTREPLLVMRPLRYQTSEIVKGDAIDDAFYNRRSDDRPADKFTDVIKTILPGTQLILKSLDTALSEFIFEDGMGNEHCLSFSERNNLMTQTSVFEEVRNYLETKGESK